jgi:hypothetical protein
LLDAGLECPEQLVSKKTEINSSYPPGQVLIGPNETRWFSIESEKLPDFMKSLPKWCFRITQVKVSPP